MVDFICMGLLIIDLLGTQTENYKMKNSCPQLDSNLESSAYEASALSNELSELINTDHLKASTFFLSVLHVLKVNLVDML